MAKIIHSIIEYMYITFYSRNQATKNIIFLNNLTWKKIFVDKYLNTWIGIGILWRIAYFDIFRYLNWNWRILAYFGEFRYLDRNFIFVFRYLDRNFIFVFRYLDRNWRILDRADLG